MTLVLLRRAAYGKGPDAQALVVGPATRLYRLSRDQPRPNTERVLDVPARLRSDGWTCLELPEDKRPRPKTNLITAPSRSAA
jgi:hypothetical protein